MSYKKNDIEITEFDKDSRDSDGYDLTNKFVGKFILQLPHSCDEWIIGGVKEAEIMLEDLKQALFILKEKESGKC